MKVLDNAKLSSVAGGGLFQLGPGNILMPIRFWLWKMEILWKWGTMKVSLKKTDYMPAFIIRNLQNKISKKSVSF